MKKNKISEINISNKQKITFSILTFSIILLIILSYIYSGKLESYLLNSEISKTSSLFIVSLLIGLLDGFNPCAMWILIYLITLVSTLQDKKKMWLIVGTFLMASGILYYIILALWLNGWNAINYVISADYILTGAGIFALVSGIYFIYEFIKSGGQLECKVADSTSRKKTMSKIKDIVHSPFTLPTFLALVALAFAINLLEFVCSVALPALFTQVLSVSSISLISKYFYMFVYTLAFMADDILIFVLALKAIESPIMAKYSGFAKIAGGILMLILGIIILFFPSVLI